MVYRTWYKGIRMGVRFFLFRTRDRPVFHPQIGAEYVSDQNTRLSICQPATGWIHRITYIHRDPHMYFYEMGDGGDVEVEG